MSNSDKIVIEYLDKLSFEDLCKILYFGLHRSDAPKEVTAKDIYDYVKNTELPCIPLSKGAIEYLNSDPDILATIKYGLRNYGKFAGILSDEDIIALIKNYDFL